MISVTSPSSPFAHCGDLHIGASYVHGDEDAGGVSSRLVDFRDSWVRSCKDMVACGVKTVIIAGDAFHTAKPTPTELAAFVAGLEIIEKADLDVIAIIGNHDQPRNTGRAHALQVFADRITVVDRPSVIRSGNTWFACMPHVNRAHIAAADPEFAALDIDEQNARIVELTLASIRGLAAQAEQAAMGNRIVLVAHGTIGGSTVGAANSTAFFREPVIPLSELRGLPFDYQAWAHLHRMQMLDKNIWYCGSIDRIDFAECDEDKGWLLVDTVDGELVVAGRSSGARDFIDIDLSTDAEQGWDELIAGDVVDVNGAVVRVQYTATPEQAKTVDHGAIRRALYAAGAVKVHGPFAEILHDVTTRTETTVTEDTDPLTAWSEYAPLQGIEPAQLARLEGRMREACEVNA